MGDTGPIDKAAIADEEVRLARAAAAGDGSAFATLYQRYERRVYNLAYRIAGSESDAADASQEAFLRAMRLSKQGEPEPNFGICLLAATRNASCGLIEKRRSTQPSDARPEVKPGREEIFDANMHLPEHQREALALRELEGLSYDEIAAVMDTDRNSVAQFIYRARINLRDETRGTVLATPVAPRPECERALPLIAARQDGQLEAGSDDDAWLSTHLSGCERCWLGVEEMGEAAASYRAWAPIAVVPWLLKETMAKAAALTGADWSDAIAKAIASRTDSQSPPANLTERGSESRFSHPRRAIAVAGLAALLLAGGVAVVLAGGEPSSVPDRPTADTHRARNAPVPKGQKKEKKHDPGTIPRTRTEALPATTAAAPAAEQAGGSESPSTGGQGASGLQPPLAIAAPEPKPSTRKPPPQPVPAQASPTVTQPPATTPTEDPTGKSPSQGRGPPGGKPPRGNF